MVMSMIWVLLVSATGVVAADSSSPLAQSPTVPSKIVVSKSETAASPTDLRRAAADALRRANAAKRADRTAAITALVNVFKELGNDRQLPQQERQRLGAEIRLRLERFATQFRYELARDGQRAPAQSPANAAGGPATDGLDNLVDLIQQAIGPQDWVLAQRIGGPGGAGQPGAGFAGQPGSTSGGGGAFGSSIDQAASANGQALVDLIQATIAPDTWDIRGGPGTIIYYNPLRALVVRQTGEVHDNLGDLLGGLRK
jgi:hypothetical protein